MTIKRYAQSAISGDEWWTIWDTFAQHSELVEKRELFIALIEHRARMTDYPFKPYLVTHHICAVMVSNPDATAEQLLTLI